MKITPLDRAAASYSTFEWRTAWDTLPAVRFQARDGRCERLVALGLLESKVSGTDILYRRAVTQLPLTIIAAAVRFQGVIFSMPRPHRHHHILHAQTGMGLRGLAHRDQGFLLSDGTYADRAAAWIIAKNAKQFKGEPHHPEHLFTEDLW